MAHTHLTSAKAKHSRGIKSVTRAEALTQRLQSKLEFVRWEYSHSHARPRTLGMTAHDAKTFLPLRASDFQQLKHMVSRREQLGEGRIILPWYWRINLADEGANSSSIDMRATDVAAEYQDSGCLGIGLCIPTLTGLIGLRVQWFHARERYKRWDEEEHWLQREAASTILDFEHRRQTWLEKTQDFKQSGWKA